MNNKKIVSTESMRASIYARSDIFSVLEKLPGYLEGGERSQRKEHVERFLDDLHTAAWARVAAYRESEAYRDFPAYLAIGHEANWLWLDRKLDYCREMRCLDAAEFLLASCETILEETYYAAPADMGKAHVILENLEKRFRYLSKVVQPDGLHMLLFPTVTRASDCFEFSAQATPNDGMEVCGVLFPAQNDHGTASEIFVYESVAAAILEPAVPGDELDEAELMLLEEHWDPMIRSRRPEDQIGAYYDAVLMGLSYGAPYGDFPYCAAYSEAEKRFWRNHAARLMDAFKGEGRV